MPNLNPYRCVRLGGLPVQVLESFSLAMDMMEAKDLPAISEFLALQGLCLQQISHSEVLQNGLLFSSQSFLSRLSKYQQKERSNFRKKEFQTERTLLQYINRIAAKSSPFSSFSPIAFWDVGQQQFCTPKTVTHHAINLEVIARFRGKNKSRLQLNPSLLMDTEVYTWLSEQTSTIQFHGIDKEPLLDLVLEYLLGQATTTRTALHQFCMAHIDASSAEISDYLDSLLELDLLRYDDSHSDDITRQQIHTKFPFLAQTETLSREQILQIKTDLELELGQPIDFPLEKIIYQNTATQAYSNIPLAVDAINSMERELAFFIQILQSYQSNTAESQIIACLTHHFKEEKQIPFTLFVKAFLEMNLPSETKPIGIPELTKYITAEKNKDKIHIPWEAIKAWIPKPTKPSPQLEVLVQFIQTEGRTQQAVLNGIALGHGKLAGRFYPMFEKTVLASQQNSNQIAQVKELWVENTDDSLHAVNQHPPLFATRIAQGIPCGKDEIPLAQLAIHWNPKTNEYRLIEQIKLQPVRILDLGLQHPAQRSQVYQILNLFGFKIPRIRPFLEQVEERLLVQQAVGYWLHPRLTIGRLVIVRKTWWLAQTLFPQRLPLEADENYFLKINAFLRSCSIPQHFFIVLSPRSYPNTIPSTPNPLAKAADYKPQYMNRDSPIHILLLERLLKRAASIVQLTEMLPEPKEVLGNTVSEYVLHPKTP